MYPFFSDRAHAGKVLADKLKKFAGQPDLVVMALPRGGVPVAFEVAKVLRTPLDVFVVRKLGFPGQPELAMGAIASGGVCVLNHALIDAYGVSKDIIDETIAREMSELQRRELEYLPGRNLTHLQFRNVILIDDGLATGATMSVAVAALRQAGCKHLVVGVPVSASDAFAAFEGSVDEIVCAKTPAYLGSVGQWYRDFTQITDDEVRQLLELSSTSIPSTGAITSAPPIVPSS